ncbi:hypothetical protein KEJ49_00415 [Candidatus Bathyarchaeota archaeon]|nr:hypothetical protein [Candidatus Bathyarchaeota archaeon]
MFQSDVKGEQASILFEAAENVRRSVLDVLRERRDLEVKELKRVLDLSAHNAIRETLSNLGASMNVVSEEGEYTLGGGEAHLIVDPIDGTTNLARGVGYATTSIAISETPYLSGTLAAIVMELNSGLAYWAERGKGAWLGDSRIKPSGPAGVKDAMISIDISKGSYLRSLERLIYKAGHLRQLGCASISLCHVASGRIDAHIDYRGALRATDAAAALFILKEAGGVYIIDGAMDNDLMLSRGSRLRLVAASSQGLLDEIMSLIGERQGFAFREATKTREL